MKIMVDLDRVVIDCPSLLSSIGNLIFRDIHEKRRLSYKEVPSNTTMDYFNLLFFSKLSHKENFIEVGDVISIIKNWQAQGHIVEFVSSRPNIKSFYKPVIDWLNEKGIDFSKIVIACTNKAAYCKLNHFDIMVDDSLKNCSCATRLGVRAIWLQTKYHKNGLIMNIPSGVLHADSWNSINNYIQYLSAIKWQV